MKSTLRKLQLLLILPLFALAACGSPDQMATEIPTFYFDADGDGFGNPEKSLQIERENIPEGYVLEGNDCNDDDPAIHPKAKDKPHDWIDQNCDGIYVYLASRTEER